MLLQKIRKVLSIPSFQLDRKIQKALIHQNNRKHLAFQNSQSSPTFEHLDRNSPRHQSNQKILLHRYQKHLSNQKHQNPNNPKCLSILRFQNNHYSQKCPSTHLFQSNQRYLSNRKHQSIQILQNQPLHPNKEKLLRVHLHPN